MTLAKGKHEADNEYDDARTHQQVADDVEVNHLDLDIDCEHKDRAEHKQDYSGSYTHKATVPQFCKHRQPLTTLPECGIRAIQWV